MDRVALLTHIRTVDHLTLVVDDDIQMVADTVTNLSFMTPTLIFFLILGIILIGIGFTAVIFMPGL